MLEQPFAVDVVDGADAAALEAWAGVKSAYEKRGWVQQRGRGGGNDESYRISELE